MPPQTMDAPYFTFHAESDHLETRNVAGGVAVVASRTAPEKTTANEDCAAVIPVGETQAILLVADGLGGHASGEIASRMAIETMEESLRERAEENEGALDAEQLRAVIMTGIERANEAVMDLANGAATTLCIAEIQGDTVRVYHIGDSVIMLVGQRGKMKFQTLAHSPIGYAVESGLIDEADAIHHEERHLISNVLGSPEMRIEVGPPRKMSLRDTLILTSDGLLDNLLTDEIIERCRKGPLPKAVERLVADARQRMEAGPTDDHPSKPDDLTIVAFRRSG
ncbi:PP2C family protein-serine/threonine phosphatase [Bythopirellula polymerisocia]|uniref:Serine/threonine phosphatase stp n=1 Tax=Bythopirellula polymerisocia TaxID=2528003 RepID=A0A5C6CXI4_9BACT|nr:protein phosphatase 2C domain-containing protein [Bythopirellula polymerisocia]TWU28247.1 Serine/threonine phosphatase stp [Bythopirellula polymerisocia]